LSFRHIKSMKNEVLDEIVDKKLLREGDRVLVAVSGGSDSVALLHLLKEIAADLNLDLVAAHLDHGLRPRSSDDALFVEKLCRQWNIPFVIHRITGSEISAAGRGGIEQAARKVRRTFLEETARRFDCRRIALGHHHDDQAETVLHRLLRGSGPAGLTAMRPRSGIYVRPLLSVPRSRIRSYLDFHDLTFCHDESNDDLRFTRNLIRHQLLPLCRLINPRVEEALTRLARRLSCEEDYWRRQVTEAVSGWSLASGFTCAPREEINRLHPALRDRVLRHLVEVVRGNLRGVEEKHIAALARLVEGTQGSKELHLPGITACRSYDELHLRAGPPGTAEPYRQTVTAPGLYRLPGGWRVEFTLASKPGPCDGRTAVEFDATQVTFPLILRSREAGDRMAVAGMSGRRKIKDIFIDEKVPQNLRRSCPVLEHDGRILWLAGLRRCNDDRPDEKTRKILRVALLP